MSEPIISLAAAVAVACATREAAHNTEHIRGPQHQTQPLPTTPPSSGGGPDLVRLTDY